MMSTDGSERLYEDYLLADEWTGEVSEDDRAFFDTLTARLGWSSPKRLFEIGFGGGGFLDLAKAHGHDATGVEPLKAQVEAVRARGHDVFEGVLTADLAYGAPFDAVCAFDVLEHLTIGEIIDTLTIAVGMLKPDGVIVAQFPNGASPFGLAHQTGDGTHRTTLSLWIMKQVGRRIGMPAVEEVRMRPMPRGLARKLRRGASYLVRDAVETVLGMAYFGHRQNLDPNTLVVMRRD